MTPVLKNVEDPWNYAKAIKIRKNPEEKKKHKAVVFFLSAPNTADQQTLNLYFVGCNCLVIVNFIYTCLKWIILLFFFAALAKEGQEEQEARWFPKDVSQFTGWCFGLQYRKFRLFLLLSIWWYLVVFCC